MKVVFENLTKKYGEVTAVSNLNLTIESGSLHFLLGPSGCGKTTTLRLFAGLESVSEGRILFDNQDVTNKRSAERGIGMVFQNYALWPHMTVEQNILYGLKLRKLEKKEITRRISEVIGFTQLNGLESRYPGQLSGGQQQRVALARALAIKPSVLLLDEPLSNLDAKLRVEMRENISRIHRETGITTFYVTHDQKEALSMGTHITVMKRGIEQQTGTPKELFNKPNSSFLAGFIGETNIITGVINSIENDGFITIDTILGNLKARTELTNIKKGDSVQLSLRPCDIFTGLENKDNSKENSFSLPLYNSTYLGEVEQLNLNMPDSKMLKVNVYHPKRVWIPNEEIFCKIVADRVIVLPIH